MIHKMYITYRIIKYAKNGIWWPAMLCMACGVNPGNFKSE